MLADNDGRDVYLQHAGSLALASIGDAAALEAPRQHTSRGVRIAAVVALRRMRHAGVARFLADADEAIVTDAARGDQRRWRRLPAAVPALAALLGDDGVHQRAVAAPRASTPTCGSARNDALARRVGLRRRRLAARAELRVEAVSALGVWAAPSPLDRVDGFYLAPFDLPTGQPADATTPGATRRAARAAVAALIDGMAAEAGRARRRR